MINIRFIFIDKIIQQVFLIILVALNKNNLMNRLQTVYAISSQGYFSTSRPYNHPTIVRANQRNVHLDYIRCNEVYKGQSQFKDSKEEELYKSSRSMPHKSQMFKSQITHASSSHNYGDQSGRHDIFMTPKVTEERKNKTLVGRSVRVCSSITRIQKNSDSSSIASKNQNRIYDYEQTTRLKIPADINQFKNFKTETASHQRNQSAQLSGNKYSLEVNQTRPENRRANLSLSVNYRNKEQVEGSNRYDRNNPQGNITCFNMGNNYYNEQVNNKQQLNEKINSTYINKQASQSNLLHSPNFSIPNNSLNNLSQQNSSINSTNSNNYNNSTSYSNNNINKVNLNNSLRTSGIRTDSQSQVKEGNGRDFDNRMSTGAPNNNTFKNVRTKVINLNDSYTKINNQACQQPPKSQQVKSECKQNHQDAKALSNSNLGHSSGHVQSNQPKSYSIKINQFSLTGPANQNKIKYTYKNTQTNINIRHNINDSTHSNAGNITNNTNINRDINIINTNAYNNNISSNNGNQASNSCKLKINSSGANSQAKATKIVLQTTNNRNSDKNNSYIVNCANQYQNDNINNNNSLNPTTPPSSPLSPTNPRNTPSTINTTPNQQIITDTNDINIHQVDIKPNHQANNSNAFSGPSSLSARNNTREASQTHKIPCLQIHINNINSSTNNNVSHHYQNIQNTNNKSTYNNIDHNTNASINTYSNNNSNANDSNFTTNNSNKINNTSNNKDNFNHIDNINVHSLTNSHNSAPNYQNSPQIHGKTTVSSNSSNPNSSSNSSLISNNKYHVSLTLSTPNLQKKYSESTARQDQTDGQNSMKFDTQHSDDRFHTQSNASDSMISIKSTSCVDAAQPKRNLVTDTQYQDTNFMRKIKNIQQQHTEKIKYANKSNDTDSSRVTVHSYNQNNQTSQSEKDQKLSGRIQQQGSQMDQIYRLKLQLAKKEKQLRQCKQKLDISEKKNKFLQSQMKKIDTNNQISYDDKYGDNKNYGNKQLDGSPSVFLYFVLFMVFLAKDVTNK